MITAINWKASGNEIATFNGGVLRSAYGHVATDWLNLLLKKGGEISKKEITAKQTTLRAIWTAYVEEPVTLCYKEDKAKNRAVAQLHAKTPGNPDKNLEQRIDALASRFATVLQDETLSPEEKFILTQECFPEKMAPFDVINTLQSPASVGEFNGLIYLTVTNSKERVSGILTKAYITAGSVLFTAYREGASQRLAHIAEHPVGISVKGYAPVNAAICTEGDFIILTHETENLMEGREDNPKGAIFSGPNGTSLLTTAKRVVLALANFSSTPLNLPTGQAAARLAIFMRYPIYIPGNSKHPFHQRSVVGADGKTQEVPALITLCPNLVTRFPHEDAMAISWHLTEEDVQDALFRIHQKLKQK